MSEALDLEAANLSLDLDQPTIRARQGKGGRSRIVPVHPELLNALDAVLQFSQIGRGRIIPVSRSTAWRWVQAGVDRAVALGAFPAGRLALTPSATHTPVTCCSTGFRSITCPGGWGTGLHRRRWSTWSWSLTLPAGWQRYRNPEPCEPLTAARRTCPRTPGPGEGGNRPHEHIRSFTRHPRANFGTLLVNLS